MENDVLDSVSPLTRNDVLEEAMRYVEEFLNNSHKLKGDIEKVKVAIKPIINYEVSFVIYPK